MGVDPAGNKTTLCETEVSSTTQTFSYNHPSPYRKVKNTSPKVELRNPPLLVDFHMVTRSLKMAPRRSKALFQENDYLSSAQKDHCFKHFSRAKEEDETQYEERYSGPPESLEHLGTLELSSQASKMQPSQPATLREVPQGWRLRIHQASLLTVGPECWRNDHRTL